MKSSTIIGIVLIIIGGFALAYDAISYTTEEEVVDVGPLEATVEETESIPLPTAVGGVVLVAGVLVLVAGRVRS